VNGTTVLHLNKKALPEFEIRIPSEYEARTMNDEGVQKVFGTLDLFVSLLETEIKYPILQGGILPFWTPSLQENDRPICLRDTLLPKLMSGKLKIKEIEAKLDGQTNC